MGNQPSVKVNSVFDIVKFVLCFVVMAVHTSLLPHYLYPWLRIAVPLYFTISSYFFFSKINRTPDKEGQKKAVLTFIKRNLQLYAFWFIVLLPFTLKLKSWFKTGISLKGIRLFFRDLIFSSTFKASWFISALLLAVIVVYFLSKIFNDKIIIGIAVLSFVFVCSWSSYIPFLDDYRIVKLFTHYYELLFNKPFTSFPAAMLWVVCGKLFAEKKINIKPKVGIAVLIVSSAALYTESYLLEKYTCRYGMDCYFSLAPLCISAFALLCQIKPFQVSCSVILRKISTVVYALHNTVAYTLFGYIEKNDKNVTVFLITLAITVSVSVLILLLERFRPFRWLKYSH